SDAGLPIIPGSEGVVEGEDAAVEMGSLIGYPVMIKAAAGGGGRGIRIAENETQIRDLFYAAGREAEAFFGSGGLYVEKYIESPRHIEVQILGDGKGNVIQFGERECSIQRRHQKLIEESPSPGIGEDARRRIAALAVKGAESIGYGSLGTMEFLVDRDENVFFLEMNTRVQVEHTVTEMVTGLDLIKEQIKFQNVGSSALFSDFVSLRGHAIECRINAEDPENDFKPSPGEITFYHPPGGFGVRVDSHLYDGYVVPPYYDSLLAKIITWGETREEARRRMKRSLSECIIEGIPTTIAFLISVIEDPQFVSGSYDTSFLERFGKA
ncbi:MAG: ATP-grasp domain-containing protein, partial [Candidatus Krumholzibacteria bacterium]|nr:ATP-grasp domain-containing protein [Candidatus Krumholzibacteria bacterium]